MSVTVTANIVYPDKLWSALIAQKTTKLSALRQSGIVATSEEYANAVSDRSFAVSVPFVNPLHADGQVPVEGTAWSVNAMSGNAQTAPNLIWGIPVGWTDLVSKAQGKDMADFVTGEYARLWVQNEQTALIAIMNGLFSASGGVLYGSHCNDISGGSGGAELVSSDALVDTAFLMGDNFNAITAVAMHSKMLAYCIKNGIVTMTTTIMEPQTSSAEYTLMGKTVICDDGVPFNTETKIGDIYLFGNGAFGYGAGVPAGGVSNELQRNALQSGGETVFVGRHWCILAPQGVSFTGKPANSKKTPDFTDLAIAANWTKVAAEDKMIRLCVLRAKVA